MSTESAVWGRRGDGERIQILFLCTGNSARSQIAEGWCTFLANDVFEARSAGTAPRGVDPRAVQVMSELDVDIALQRSKNLTEYSAVPFDLVVTLCDSARAACPVFPGGVQQVHVGFDDPPASAAGEADTLDLFRQVRDEIRAFIVGLRLGYQLQKPAELRVDGSRD